MPSVLLLDGDLLARARVEEAARGAGLELVTASSDAGGEALLEPAPDLVIVDLDRGRDAALVAVGAARAVGLAAPVIGFFSHVDVELGAAAEAAGIRTFRRGRFWAELPALLEG